MHMTAASEISRNGLIMKECRPTITTPPPMTNPSCKNRSTSFLSRNGKCLMSDQQSGEVRWQHNRNTHNAMAKPTTMQDTIIGLTTLEQAHRANMDAMAQALPKQQESPFGKANLPAMTRSDKVPTVTGPALPVGRPLPRPPPLGCFHGPGPTPHVMGAPQRYAAAELFMVRPPNYFTVAALTAKSSSSSSSSSSSKWRQRAPYRKMQTTKHRTKMSAVFDQAALEAAFKLALRLQPVTAVMQE